jgi:hypothetical protein
MTEILKAFYEEVATGHLPRKESEEYKAYMEDKNRDYTWAIQEWNRILDQVGEV